MTRVLFLASLLVISGGCPDAPAASDTRDAASEVDDSTAVDSDEGDGHTEPCWFEPADPGFDDHTVDGFDAVQCVFEYAERGGPFPSDPVALKFALLDFLGTPAVRFYDNSFYKLHDEWYWFRLLNGQAIPNLESPGPVSGFAFETIADIYDHFAGVSDLPLDLAFIGSGAMAGRMYSAEFYRLAGISADPQVPRFFGLGTLLHFSPNPNRKFPEEIWAFELEYSDKVDISEIELFFDELEAHLPASIRGKLRWVTRSGAQQSLATTLKVMGHRLGGRTLRYADLVVSGAVEVYNPGIAAGRVHILDPDFSPSSVREPDLAVISTVPDDIPPSRAILSSIPQTALAHVNLLAKSRGTPNAHVAGILEWTQLGDWEYLGTPVIVSVTDIGGQGKIRWQPITVDQLTTYETLLAPPERHVANIELSEAPLTVPLDHGGISQMTALVPLIGGKAAGFLSFLEVESMKTPERPIAITIKSFREHMEDLDPLIREALIFPEMADTRVRLLVLEGELRYREVHDSDPAALAFLATVMAAHTDDALAEVIARGGVVEMVREKPMKVTTLAALREALTANFAALPRTRALRFRSSSTAEDVPGFNGAGLYVSHTGYLYPSLQEPSDRDRTVERAIKDTWASYWGFQAFEERRAARIDHFEGAMGLVVHPRFDDDNELANAVATFWWSDYGVEVPRRLVINVQAGALLVTNPGGTVEKPEIAEVIAQPGEAPEVVRLQRSTLSPEKDLFSDAQLLAIFADAEAHAGRWLEEISKDLPDAERPRTLVLDYELKHMADAGILWKQARVLDQVARVTTQGDPFGGPLPLTQALPTDLRTVARRVEVERCVGGIGEFRVYRVFTEPSADLFPFGGEPFVYRIWVDIGNAPQGSSLDPRPFTVPWTSLIEATSEDGRTRVFFDAPTAELLGFEGFEIGDEGYRVYEGAALWSGECAQFLTRRPFQSAPEFLRSLLPEN
jgi:hypothetical protein